MKRRQILKYSASLPLLGGSTLLLKACGGSGGDGGAQPKGTLPIPALVRADAATPVTLKIQKGQYEFLAGKKSDTFGINGALLGPALLVKSDAQFNVRVENALDEDSVLHWHGLLVDGGSDGGPASAVGPGKGYAVKTAVSQPAATLWYHAHPHRRTGYQTAMGVGGLLVVEDDASAALGLPHAWGEDDVPLVLQDKYLNADGKITYKLNHNTVGLGWFGQHMFVNGVQQPTHYAPRGWVRLRLLNACNARVLKLRLGDHAAFQVIASDGGLLAAPVPVTELVLAAAERFEILVDGSAGQPIELVMARYDEQYGANAAPFDVDRTLLTIHPTLPARNGLLPPLLAELPEAQAPQGARERPITFQLMGHFPIDPDPTGPLPEIWPFDFAWNEEDSVFDDHTLAHINQIEVDGAPMESFSLDTAGFSVPRGTYERWRLTLRTGDTYPHPFHVHGTQFRILAINGGAVPAHLQGWKDTVNIPGAANVRGEPGHVDVLVRFDHAAAMPHPYMVHCHNLEHEDGGMMLGFEAA